MDFKQRQTIYLQIARSISEKILQGEYLEEAKIPSIRTTAVDFQVNPNTVQRTYEFLTNENIIYTQRGLGYFVSNGAKKIILNSRKKDFLDDQLPVVLKNMLLLDIDLEILIKTYNNLKNTPDENIN
ncbi:MAG: GntR family transcriptional regulator [Arenicella sp.]|jgi:GntR family transcriptional regulator